MNRAGALSLGLFLVAGCGGGGGSSVPAASQSSPQSKSATGSVVISIPLSTGTLSARVRYPQFVSPNAQSVALSVNGGTDQMFNVATGSPLCTTVAGSRNCTLSFAAPAGSDTFAFLIFAGPNGTGSQLAAATTTQAIAASTPFNFTVAMNAAVGMMVVNFAVTGGQNNCPDSPMNFNGLNEGCAGTATATVAVDDPSGAQITGSAPYATPIQVTSNEPTISVSPTQITAPGQTVTLTSTGAPWTGITTALVVTMTAGGQTGSVSVPAEQSNLYVANSNAAPGTTPTGGGNVVVYRFGATTPSRSLTGLTNPVQPLLDSSGNLWVLDNGPYTSNSNPFINIYAPGATGGATPIKQITAFAALDFNTACETMAFNPAQTQLFVTCDDGAIHVFPTNFVGSAAASSLQTVSLTDDSWSGPEVGMAFDNSGNLYVADTGFNTIDQYIVGSLPTSGAFQSIGASHDMSGSFGSWPSNVSPLILAVDNSGTLFATISYPSSTPGAPDANNQLAIWKTAIIPCNNCTPSASLLGGAFATHSPAGLAFDPIGNAYISNPFNNTVTEYARATIANAGPNTNNPVALRTINTGASPNAPNGMIVGP